MTTPPFISEVVEEFEKTVENRLMAGNRPLSEEIPWIMDFLREKLTAVYERGRGERDIIPFSDALDGKTAMVMVGTYGGRPIMFASSDTKATNELVEIIRQAALTTEGE